MGKKYIIELESGTHIFVLGPEGIVHIGEPDVVYETVDGMQIGDAVINAKPYTEPDLEQVRKDAYEEGYKTAKIQCGIQAEKDMREVGERHYQRGLSDAWEVARKISLAKIDGGFSWESMNNMFGTDSPSKIYKTFTASEAIEKIRQYEQEQENEFKVGDEFENEKSGKKFVVLKMNGKEIDRYIDADGKTYCMTVKYKEKRKTGRHFPEIAAVLKKMREDGNQNRIQETMSDDY